RETTSAENGNFSFKDLSPGNYVLKIEVSGFERYEKSLVVQGQEVKPLKIKLKVGGARQQVTVDADAADEAPSTSDSDAATARIVTMAVLRCMPGTLCLTLGMRFRNSRRIWTGDYSRPTWAVRYVSLPLSTSPPSAPCSTKAQSSTP